MIGSPCPNIYGSDEDGIKPVPALSDSAALILEHRALIDGVIEKHERLEKGGEYEELAKAFYAQKTLGRVYQHSIKDGIALSESMNVGAFSLVDIISDPVFVAKHLNFCRKILDRLFTVVGSSWYPNDSVPRALRGLFIRFRNLSEHGSVFGHMYPGSEFPKLRKNGRADWEEVVTLKNFAKDQCHDPQDSEIGKIDQHYSQYLQVRRFSEETPTYTLTATDKAEEHLKMVSIVLQGAYYYGDLKKVFESSAGDEFSRRRIANYFKSQPARNLITYQEIEGIAEKLKIDLEPLRRRIEKTRYLFSSPVYMCERQLHCESLTSELKQKLEKRLGRVVAVVFEKSKSEFRIVLSDEEQKKLNREEAALIGLIQCVANPSLGSIGEYFKEKKGGGMTPKFRETGRVVKVFNELFKASEEFRLACLETISAKRDTDVDELADRFFNLLMRQVHKEEGLGEFKSDEEGIGNFSHPSPENCLRADSTDEFAGGGERLLNDNREVFRTSQPIEGLAITKLFGLYDPAEKCWKKSRFVVSQEWADVKERIEVSIRKTPVQTPISLPRLVAGRIEELSRLPNAVQNDLGEVIAVSVDGRGLKYSIQYPEVAPVMQNITEQEYSKFRQSFLESNGHDLEKSLGPISEEVDLFLQSIRDLPPLERVMRIEEYVRSIGYYDTGNDQVARKKRGKSVSRQLDVMEERMSHLCREDKDIPKLKKYAGVCADFANLTIMILRRAGFLSGIAGGFVSEGNVFKMKNNHASAYIVWPEGDKNRIFIVDGTPGSEDERLMESEIQTLRERNARSKKKLHQTIEKVEKELNVYLGGLADDEGEIKIRPQTEVPITDLDLKKLLKRISRYALSEQALLSLNAQFGLYLYSPMHDLDVTNPKDRLVIAEEVKKLSNKKAEGHVDADLSDYVYDNVNGFLKRVLESKFVKDDREAKSLLRLIVGAADQLETLDKKAVRLIAKNFFDRDSKGVARGRNLES